MHAIINEILKRQRDVAYILGIIPLLEIFVCIVVTVVVKLLIAVAGVLKERLQLNNLFLFQTLALQLSDIYAEACAQPGIVTHVN